MTRSATYTVTIRPPRDLPALLDGLRYEGGWVLSWEHDRDGTYTVTIASDHFEPDRWASFGIYPKVLS